MSMAFPRRPRMPLSLGARPTFLRERQLDHDDRGGHALSGWVECVDCHQRFRAERHHGLVLLRLRCAECAA
jgi:hypothetical protein